MGWRKTTMATRVAIRKTGKSGGEDVLAGVRQPYLHPGDLFVRPAGGSGAAWTCARTRPRWEKKFAEWLLARRREFFLPVFRRTTVSGRKRQTSELPLFPGFVFVAGDSSKKDFAASGCVAYVLKPKGERGATQLDRELTDVWRGLESGLYVAPVQNLAAGEVCRIVAGPLQGVEARYERPGRAGRLLLQVEMMGGGIAVEVSADEVEVVS